MSPAGEEGSGMHKTSQECDWKSLLLARYSLNNEGS